MKNARPGKARAATLFVPPVVLSMGGCSIGGAPSIPLAGAYFPAWLACALVGVVGSVLIRILFVRIGLDDVLPLRLLVYVSLGFAIAFAVSLHYFGR